MIEGLKVTISGSELKDLCIARANYHGKRKKDYETSLRALKALNVPNTSNRPGDDAEHKIIQHATQAAELQFMAEHIDVSERFLLDINDLVKLGVSYRGF